MLKMLTPALAGAALAVIAMPATAQEEEPRTTYRIMMIDVADSGQSRWEEIVMEHIMPAYEAAGMTKPQLHWTMLNDDWDMMVVETVPGGMATFDHHRPAARMAIWNALVAQEGSEEAVNALFEELNGLEDKTQTIYTHTHP